MPNFKIECLDINISAKQNISTPFKSALRGSYMSVGIVRNEIGNFRPFSKISSFFSQKWFKVYKFWKNDLNKLIFYKKSYYNYFTWRPII